MKRLTCFLILALLPLTLFAQPKALVEIKTDAKTVKRLNLPVYFRDQQVFIVLADEKMLEQIPEAKSRVRLLAADVSVKDYYLISKKDCTAPDLSSIAGNVVYNNGTTAIVRASAEDLIVLYKNGNRILQMSEKPMVVRAENQTYHQNSSRPLNPLIQSLTSEIRTDSISSYIQKLQDMQTRFCQAPNRRAVAVWIRNKFMELGVTDAVLDSNYIQAYSSGGVNYPQSWQYNVVATITGSENPDEIVIVGGHHDSIVGNVPGSQGMDPLLKAPGADDNASAVAACFESARVIAKKNYQPKCTIKFITFAAEEHGLWGSRYYAGRAAYLQQNIKLMINNDMISYNPSSDWNIRIFPYTGAESYAQRCKQLTEDYTSLNVTYGSYNSQGSDSYAFYYNGYPAVYFFEQVFTPYYHTYNDLLSTCNIPYCAEVIKGSVAMLIHTIEAPADPRNLQLADLGNGTQLKAVWNKNKDNDLAGYTVFIGTASGIYTQDFTTADTTMLISGLTSGTNYFIGVMAKDNDQNESMIIEANATPLSIPAVPAAISADPIWNGIYIHWQTNSELDFAGYNLYRSIDNQNFVKINQELLTVNHFEDGNISIDGYRYYKATAVDISGNESEKSAVSAVGVPVTLNKGILIVDESPNGSGTAISPNDAQQDQYFNALTANCQQVQHYDAQANNRVGLADLGAYSTVIWHNQSAELGSVFNTCQAEVKKYLDFGGKILISADKPAKLIMSNNSYPALFADSLMVNHYFGIEGADYKAAARFSGAVPVAAGFDYLTVDSSKTTETNGFHLKKIEALQAVSSAEIIYSYDSKYPSTDIYGALKGKPVGITHSGTNFKTAILAIPLYFIKQNDAKKVVEYILSEKFGEPVNIDENELAEDKNSQLLQNYPNPFNNLTVIDYNLSADAFTKLTIYNAKGEIVKNLVSKNQPAGKHQVSFEASSYNSGVYFYKLDTAGKSTIRKMLLLK